MMAGPEPEDDDRRSLRPDFTRRFPVAKPGKARPRRRAFASIFRAPGYRDFPLAARAGSPDECADRAGQPAPFRIAGMWRAMSMTSANDWSGSVGDVWAEEWQRTDRCLAGLAVHLNAAILDKASTGQRGDRRYRLRCGRHEHRDGPGVARTGALSGSTFRHRLIGIATERRQATSDNLSFRCGPAEDHLAGLAPVDLDRLAPRRHVLPRSGRGLFRPAARDGAGCRPRLLLLQGDGVQPVGDGSCVCGRWAKRADAARRLCARAVLLRRPRCSCAPSLTEAGWSRIEGRPVDFSYRAGQGIDPVGDALSFFQRIGPAAAPLRQASGRRAPGDAGQARSAYRAPSFRRCRGFPGRGMVMVGA